MLYAVIGLQPNSFLLGVYPSMEAAEKAVGGRDDLWTIFRQVAPQK